MALPTDHEIEQAGPWFQRITFPSGLMMGEWHTESMMERLSAGVDFAGKTAWDLGCFAGAATKWMEEHGAAVRSCDIAELAQRQFCIVKRSFHLRAEFELRSVYDLDERRDIVLMAGLYYHLRHPLLGLEVAWENTGKVLLVEGEVAPGEEPVMQFNLGEYKGDGSNWWIPTRRCLLDMLESLPGEKRIVEVRSCLMNRAYVQVWRA